MCLHWCKILLYPDSKPRSWKIWDVFPLGSQELCSAKCTWLPVHLASTTAIMLARSKKHVVFNWVVIHPLCMPICKQVEANRINSMCRYNRNGTVDLIFSLFLSKLASSGLVLLSCFCNNPLVLENFFSLTSTRWQTSWENPISPIFPLFRNLSALSKVVYTCHKVSVELCFLTMHQLPIFWDFIS